LKPPPPGGDARQAMGARYHGVAMISLSITPKNPSRGFTLIEVVVVMLIFSVVIAMVAVMTRGVTAAQKRSLTATRMATVEAALIQFVLQQKRLPCPANGALPSTDANAGLEVGWHTTNGCTGTMQNGVVPWRAVALTDVEISDGWERRLTYRVYPALGATNGMDMSWCDPAGTENTGVVPRACNPLCLSTALGACTPPAHFLGTTKGIAIRNVAGTVLMDPAGTPNTGAAYVLISHGESGGGGYLNTGVLATSTIGDGTEELRNYASLPYVLNVTFYVDDSTNDTATAAHFDDIVSRPSIMAVASKAGLAPRAH
jgi:prepilin-type N-terminal cleavage/methylation domain-containing protein